MIQLHQISKTYADGTRALNGVDLEFGRGLIGLLGPNGAGKTTLLSILTLAQEPSSGARTYFGIADSARHRPAIRRMIGYLPQEFEPIADLSGVEYLELCARWRQVPLSRRGLRGRIDALLEAVELTSAAHRRADRYSGGMIRRLGLAQALIHGPKFLVVDEPTAGLDPEERIRFRNLITDFAEEIPVLLSTHIVEDIEATCPRLAVIAQGRLLFDGGPSELMRRAEGSLWQVASDAELASSWVRVGRRVAADGQARQVIYSAAASADSASADSAPADSEPIAPTLEEACSLFLAQATDLEQATDLAQAAE